MVSPPRSIARPRAGCWSVGLDESGDRSLFELDLADQPIVLVLGSEGKGLARLTRDRCDVLVRIPMQGHLDSLNVSAAAALACHEIARRRNGRVERVDASTPQLELRAEPRMPG